MENFLGRSVEKPEVIHHINGKKWDNNRNWIFKHGRWHKECSMCKKYLPVSKKWFYTQKNNGATKYQGMCKDCKIIFNRKYRKGVRSIKRVNSNKELKINPLVDWETYEEAYHTFDWHKKILNL